jgi:hypothetical protein
MHVPEHIELPANHKHGLEVKKKKKKNERKNEKKLIFFIYIKRGIYL